MNQKNLIIGSVWGGWFPNMEVFLASVASCGYKGDVVLFVDGMTNEETRKLTGLGIQVERVPFAVSGQARRYQVWYNWLDKHPGYRNIMLTDVLDVAFQKDPFELLNGDELLLFLQDRKIGETPELDWIAKVFRPEAYDHMSNFPISTTGVVIGSFRRITDYLILMARKQLDIRETVPNMATGLHNFLLYTDLLAGSRVFDNHSGPVVNLNGIQHTLGEGGLIYNASGQPVYVVHQWDRPGLEDYMHDHFKLSQLEKA